MSDCVRFMTFNDTGAPANSSGCNGFAWPTPATGTTGTGTTNPASFTLQQAVALWWKVKNWTLASSCVVNGSAGTPNSFVNGVLNINASNPTTEKNLYDHAFPVHEWGNGTSGVNVFDISLLSPPNWVNNGTGVWPALNLSATGLVDLDGSAFCPINFSTGPPLVSPSGPMTGTIVLVAADTSYNISADLYYDDSLLILAGASFTPGPWTLTATEYWPFAALADGSPIYDVSSGFSLQNPAN